MWWSSRSAFYTIWVLEFILRGISTAWAFDSFEKVRAQTVPSEGIVYDRNREIIHESRVDPGGRRLSWIPLQEMSPALREAVVYSEDRRFWRHSGVDWRALLKATSSYLFGSSHRGASTLSMQVAALLDHQLVPKKLRRSLIQKVKQLHGAQELEKQWSKSQILEAYLNLVSFRGELRGVSAASYGLFQKAPHGLNLTESIILAALIRSPQASLPELKRRACRLGNEMKGPDFICKEVTAILERGSFRNYSIPHQSALAPHLAQKVLKSSEATVTLDRKLQAFVIDSLRRQVLSIHGQNVRDAAALIVENETGEVLAYVGGVGDLSTARYVDGIRAPRQAGSTLKPFLYGIALEKKYLTPASFLDDSPLNLPVLGGVYRPKNYDQEFHGKTFTLRTALASSLNVPAVKTLHLIGVKTLVKKLEDLGFSNLQDADFYGPSLALGSADISLWELVNAYRTFANQGVWSELIVQKEKFSSKTRKRVYSPETAFIISDILSDRESRSLTFGLENFLSLRFWTAVKTGTSKDMRDNWCVGFSRLYTVGVWVGNFSGESMWNVTGMSGAAPAWSEIMKNLHEKKSSNPPLPPQGVVRAAGDGRKEWFIRGTEPLSHLKQMPLHKNLIEMAKISYPVEGMVIAYDPDIPEESQRVTFEANIKDLELSWTLNGKELEQDGGDVSWQPQTSGKYELCLLSPSGQVLDTVHFKVIK